MSGSPYELWGRNPDYKVVIDLSESLGQFYRDLSDPLFVNVQESMNNASSYMARAIIHNLLGIPGGMTLREAARFFPNDLQRQGMAVVEHFWNSMSVEISRAEKVVAATNLGRPFTVCYSPEPFIDRHSTLTIWYRWLSGSELAYRAMAEQGDGDEDTPCVQTNSLGY